MVEMVDTNPPFIWCRRLTLCYELSVGGRQEKGNFPRDTDSLSINPTAAQCRLLYRSLKKYLIWATDAFQFSFSIWCVSMSISTGRHITVDLSIPQDYLENTYSICMYVFVDAPIVIWTDLSKINNFICCMFSSCRTNIFTNLSAVKWQTCHNNNYS